MPAEGFAVAVQGGSATIATADELVVALDVLQGRHDREVLEQLRPHLADIIGPPPGLYATLRVLQPDDQIYLLEALGERLVDVVQKPSALRDILATLGEERVEATLLRTLGHEGLARLIGTPEELGEVLEWVYGQCDELALELLGPESIAERVQTGEELSLVLRALDAARQHKLLGELGAEWVAGLVRDERDLAYLLRAMPGEVGRELLECFSQADLKRLIRNDAAWRSLEHYLEADEAAALRARLEGADNAE